MGLTYRVRPGLYRPGEQSDRRGTGRAGRASRSRRSGLNAGFLAAV
nr:hypothetical protein RVX_2565 [Nitratidesulfovibrio sp. HK-II]